MQCKEDERTRAFVFVLDRNIFDIGPSDRRSLVEGEERIALATRVSHVAAFPLAF